jgi:anthranilate phosphoribosyltransferase
MTTEPESHHPVALLAAMPLLFGHKDLTREQARAIMEEILSGQASGMQIAMFITALRMKGEVAEEVIGFAQVARERATPIVPYLRQVESISGTGRDSLEGPLLDTCGTGGDLSGTFNISTALTFVVAGCGVRVAKHSNRSISSQCGSVDVLETLGVDVYLSPKRLAACIDIVGIGILFAPSLHAAWKYTQPVRRDIRIRTVFNMLGTLCNPAEATTQISGVYEPRLTTLVANALLELGVQRAFVFHGSDGLDEITLTGPTKIAEIVDGTVKEWTLNPTDYGLKLCKITDLRGGDVAENARIIRDILDGRDGPKRDIVLLNAAAGLVAAGRVSDIPQGLEKAAHAIDSGAARDKLAGLIEISNQPGD